MRKFKFSPKLSPLVLATIKGEIDNVKLLLLKKGTEVNSEERAFTPLMWAAYHQHLNIVSTLLEFKADINQINKCSDTALSIAVRNGHIDVVKSLLEYKSNINMAATPELHMAAIHDRKEIAIMLLREYKVDINQKDDRNETALMKAAYCGKLNVINALLEFKNIDVHCINNSGKTARDIAAKKNHQAVVKALDEFIAFKSKEEVVELLLLKAIPPLPDKSHDPEAWHAIQSILNPSSVEIDENLLCPITHMLLKDPVFTADGHTYERKAIEQWLGGGHDTSPLTNQLLENKKLAPNFFARGQVEKFLKKNPGLELKDSTEEIQEDLVKRLLNACLSGEQKIIQDLVSQDSRLLVHSFGETYKGHTALHFAIAHPLALDTVVELLESHHPGLALAGLLRKNDEGRLPIHHHIDFVNEFKRRCPEDVVTLLKLSMWMGQKISLVSVPPKWPKNLNNHALINALALSVQNGNLEITRFFLRLGANPEAKNAKGETRVYQAVKKGHYDCLVALLEAKADPNLDDPCQNDTPLHYAVQYGATKVTSALVRAGAKLDKELKNGWTSLHVAAQESTIEILDILLNGQQTLPKQLINAQDNQGNTALHLAVAANMIDNAVWLLKYKANPLLFNTLGNTTLHEAAKAGFIEIIKILLKAGVPAELKNEKGLSARQLAESNNQDAATQVLFLAENKPTKVKKKKKGKKLILEQQELIYQQKKEIEQLRLIIEEKNQALKQSLSEIKLPGQENSKSGSDNKKSLPEFYGQHPFFRNLFHHMLMVSLHQQN